MTYIAVDRNVLLNAAQQLEVRCDPLAIASELRVLANGSQVTPHELVDDLAREVRSYGKCRGGIHSKEKCNCRYCRSLAHFDTLHPAQK
jgi:hypothetical protein